MHEAFRALPSVDQVVERLHFLQDRYPRTLIVEEVRRTIAVMREQIRRGAEPGMQVESIVQQALHYWELPSLRRVINATGVVLHTNLGRAPLAAMPQITGYSNLEYDVAAGRRGKRDTHVAGLLERLIGAPAIAVNNNAAATYLALHEMSAGFEAIVSRGELIEIGDGFRIPDIMARSGAILREVGTTNRTSIEDYRNAINERTRLIMRVHPSNFRIEGFTSKPELRELTALGRERGVPVYEDLGSGCVVDLKRFGIDEPLVSDSVKAGVNVVSFSGDKLLGGPQAGILAGDAEWVERLRKNPMFRAFRLDKLIYQSLETTLRNLVLERWEQVPALRMISATADEIRDRAEAFLTALDRPGCELTEGRSVIGGGSTPEQSIPTWLIRLQCADVVEAERLCRQNYPPVIARIERDRLVLDLRTVFPAEEADLVRVIASLPV